MMNTEFQIDVRDWLGDANSEDVEDATFAALSVVAIDQQEPRGDPRQIVTRVHDTVDNSVREYIRVSAYDLAAWHATNWWRLRWEPERSGRDWKMRHKMAAAGAGYMWPDVSYASDGETILIRSRMTPRYNAPVQYLETFKAESLPALSKRRLTALSDP